MGDFLFFAPFSACPGGVDLLGVMRVGGIMGNVPETREGRCMSVTSGSAEDRHGFRILETTRLPRTEWIRPRLVVMDMSFIVCFLFLVLYTQHYSMKTTLRVTRSTPALILGWGGGRNLRT